jgi:hypothetical protein
VHRDAAELAVDPLALPGANSRADLDAERAHRIADRTRAADRSGRAVEGREEAVAGGVDFVAAEPRELAPNLGMVRLQEVAPGAVSQLGRSGGRADDGLIAIDYVCACSRSAAIGRPLNEG